MPLSTLPCGRAGWGMWPLMTERVNADRVQPFGRFAYARSLRIPTKRRADVLQTSAAELFKLAAIL